MSEGRRITQFSSAAEIEELTTASDLWGVTAVLTTWALIAASLAMVAWSPNLLTLTLALIVLGNRHLALGVLVHEAAHRSLFRTRWLNEVVGHWCGAPSWISATRYRAHHLQHHGHTNTSKDPDLGLSAPFPVTPASMARKLARDLFGLTGLRRIVGMLMMDFGVLRYSASGEVERLPRGGRSLADYLRSGAHHLWPVLVSNATLLAIVWACGHPWLYLVWFAAWMTTYSLFLRVRSMVEHACTEVDPDDPFLGTRTTLAGPLARLTFAPLFVNYHLEHHLLPTVPAYRLPRLHRLLRDRGALEGCHVTRGYLRAFAELIRRTT